MTRRVSPHAPVKFSRLEVLLEDLQKRFPPRCIKQGEDLIEAHRYAAKAELVALIVSQCTPED
ncbi:hypothetical protein IB276_22455 [Ensifer sp. ENS04]|nr:hypothetical protein [Ensifer sp. ENS04]